MKQVSFTRMSDGTKEDYLLLQSLEAPHLAATADRLLRELSKQGEESIAGYRVSRLEHALQSATRVLRDAQDDDWIVAALLHDIGDGLAPQNHDRFAAEIIRPFVREECTWVVAHHGAFQMYYYAHHYGWNPFEREKYAANPYFEFCRKFCERWDQTSFDPAYPSEPLERFAPILRRVFARRAYAEEVVRAGIVVGIPCAAGSAGIADSAYNR